MQNKKTYIWNIVFMLVLLGASFFVLLKDQDLPAIAGELRGADKGQICLAMFAAILYLVLQSISLVVILRSLGMQIKWLPSMRYSFIGFLFNAITPSASGGQPMQVLYMSADGINMGASSVALLFWTIIYKIALVLIEGVVFFWKRDLLVRALGGYMWLFLLGIAVNVVSIVLYGIVVFSKNGAKNIAGFVTWLLHKLHIVRHKDRVLKKLAVMLKSYQEGAVYMRTHLGTAFVVLLITLVQRLSYFWVTWFIVCSLNITNVDMLDVVILQSFVSVCIDILPFPGGVGVNESFFVTLFQPFIGKDYAFSTMLLSRGVSFYGLLVLSVVVTVGTQIGQIVKGGPQHEHKYRA